MSSVGNILLEKEILLESGTNEVEILVFRVGGLALGVNVAKVREILPAQRLTHLPMAHSSIIGCFNLRENVVPCVSLHHYLEEAPADSVDDPTIILTEFNQYQTAFVVDEVERIHRVNWEKVLAAPSCITEAATPVTAVTEIEGRLISMLDFEMIADHVSDQAQRPSAVANRRGLPRQDLRVLLADDSATVRQAVSETLQSSGYTNVHAFENGELAWNWIQKRLAETDDVRQVADLLISDVEMPRVDGLHLTKNIKDHPQLNSLCVLLYSSILTHDNRKKGTAVGADAMITKPELAKVVERADELLINRQSAADRSPEPPSDSQLDQEGADTHEVADDCFVGNGLWSTFQAELAGRVEGLAELCQLATDDQLTSEVLGEVFRLLHSIKSAAMVVPVDAVARLTHQIEDRLAATRQDSSQWPHLELDAYVGWLQELANPTLSEQELRSVLVEAPCGELPIVKA